MQVLLNINVHGGVTYGNFEKDYATIGFDCAHYKDLIPNGYQPEIAIYRDFTFVRAEIHNLADQLLTLRNTPHDTR